MAIATEFGPQIVGDDEEDIERFGAGCRVAACAGGFESSALAGRAISNPAQHNPAEMNTPIAPRGEKFCRYRFTV